LKVTYGIAGVPIAEDVPSILFCGGMYGVKWQAVFMNWLAEKEGVWVIFADRLVSLDSSHYPAGPYEMYWSCNIVVSPKMLCCQLSLSLP
jgi:hypothetical protein